MPPIFTPSIVVEDKAGKAIPVRISDRIINFPYKLIQRFNIKPSKIRMLSHGSNGEVFSVQLASGEEIIIKHAANVTDTPNLHVDSLQNEVTFHRAAEKLDINTANADIHIYVNNNEQFSVQERIIGVTLHSMIKNTLYDRDGLLIQDISDEELNEYFDLLLTQAQLFDKIHSKGLIAWDMHYSNIMVWNDTFYPIDWARTTFITQNNIGEQKRALSVYSVNMFRLYGHINGDIKNMSESEEIALGKRKNTEFLVWLNGSSIEVKNSGYATAATYYLLHIDEHALDSNFEKIKKMQRREINGDEAIEVSFEQWKEHYVKEKNFPVTERKNFDKDKTEARNPENAGHEQYKLNKTLGWLSSLKSRTMSGCGFNNKITSLQKVFLFNNGKAQDMKVTSSFFHSLCRVEYKNVFGQKIKIQGNVLGGGYTKYVLNENNEVIGEKRHSSWYAKTDDGSRYGSKNEYLYDDRKEVIFDLLKKYNACDIEEGKTKIANKLMTSFHLSEAQVYVGAVASNEVQHVESPHLEHNSKILLFEFVLGSEKAKLNNKELATTLADSIESICISKQNNEGELAEKKEKNYEKLLNSVLKNKTNDDNEFLNNLQTSIKFYVECGREGNEDLRQTIISGAKEYLDLRQNAIVRSREIQS